MEIGIKRALLHKQVLMSSKLRGTLYNILGVPEDRRTIRRQGYARAKDEG